MATAARSRMRTLALLIPLLLLAACDRSFPPPQVNAPGPVIDPTPAEAPAHPTGLSVTVEGGQVRAAVDFASRYGCPVLADEALAALNGVPLPVVSHGRGEWVRERRCTSGAYYPSFCSGELETRLACAAPRVEAAWAATPELTESPLVLEVMAAASADTFTFPVVLSSLTWKAERLRDGSLRLTWQGGSPPVITRAAIVRTEAPFGTWEYSVQQRSHTELVLPDVDAWSPARLELDTVVSAQQQVQLTIDVKQVLTL